MSRLTFYRHARFDGGVRTGIEIGDVSALESYEPETADFDPALLWFVDVTCEGEGLPDQPEAARQWFLDNAGSFSEFLTAAAGHWERGFDVELRPFRREVDTGPGGSRVVILVSAVRRIQAREVARQLQELARNWRLLLETLTPLTVV